jgi:hypothetical protein
MPSKPIYKVDFRQGNLSPTLDARGWGDMRIGRSAPGDGAYAADPQGLKLSLSFNGDPAAIGVYAVLPEANLLLAGRLTTAVEFDRPEGLPSGSDRPEPWAVALQVKFGNEDFDQNEPSVNVTCQFRPDGTRLNTPGGLQGDQAATLITPLDYAALSPGVFTLDHHICGVNAAGKHSVGFGALTVGPPIRESDVRAYSNAGLSGGTQDWISALGVTITNIPRVGEIRVRLRSFSVSVW